VVPKKLPIFISKFNINEEECSSNYSCSSSRKENIVKQKQRQICTKKMLFPIKFNKKEFALDMNYYINDTESNCNTGTGYSADEMTDQ